MRQPVLLVGQHEGGPLCPSLKPTLCCAGRRWHHPGLCPSLLCQQGQAGGCHLEGSREPHLLEGRTSNARGFTRSGFSCSETSLAQSGQHFTHLKRADCSFRHELLISCTRNTDSADAQPAQARPAGINYICHDAFKNIPDAP